jgi:hypothetical protein
VGLGIAGVNDSERGTGMMASAVGFLGNKAGSGEGMEMRRLEVDDWEL